MAAEGIQDFGELLLREQVLDYEALQNAREEQERTGLSLGRVLIDRGIMQEHEKNFMLQKFFGFDLISLRNTQFDSTILARIPLAFAQKHHVVAMGELGDGSLIVAMEDPSDQLLIKLLEDRLGRQLKPVLARRDDLLRAFKFYKQAPAEAEVRPGIEDEDESDQSAKSSKLTTGLIALMMFLPLLVLPPLISFDVMNLQTALNSMRAHGTLSDNDLCVYVGLGLMLWALIVWEVGGLIGEKGKKSIETDNEAGSES
ncbi:hypothetical protein LLG95_17050 [bacterium]|nr:hypothetical protein [bacterium]